MPGASSQELHLSVNEGFERTRPSDDRQRRHPWRTIDAPISRRFGDVIDEKLAGERLPPPGPRHHQRLQGLSNPPSS